jgi:hydroxymethylglutaryl-CoA reductase
MVDSRIPGFYGWPLEERRRVLRELTGIESLTALEPATLELALADKLIENVIGVLGIPLGLGLNFKLNDTDYLVPLAVEEPSVVAAFSHASKLVRLGGGFEADADASEMIGQVQVGVPDATTAEAVLEALRARGADIDDAARAAARRMESRGGGYVHHELRRLEDPEGGAPIIVVHLVVDVVDAMGANLVNHVAEATAPVIEAIAGQRVGLRILSNFCTRRMARATGRVPVEALGGAPVAHAIAEADRFARIDPYRATTHNKGFMNGVDAVALATGNDWRAIEAACHAHAARDGTYRSLTRWQVEGDALVGRTEVPMAVGTVGGITRSHPTIALVRRILGVERAQTLAGLFAAAGLAQNLAAIKALATEGIQRGHMSLHARQLAVAAGASPSEIDAVVARALATRPISAEGVGRALAEHRAQSEA